MYNWPQTWCINVQCGLCSFFSLSSSLLFSIIPFIVDNERCRLRDTKWVCLVLHRSTSNSHIRKKTSHDSDTNAFVILQWNQNNNSNKKVFTKSFSRFFFFYSRKMKNKNEKKTHVYTFHLNVSSMRMPTHTCVLLLFCTVECDCFVLPFIRFDSFLLFHTHIELFFRFDRVMNTLNGLKSQVSWRWRTCKWSHSHRWPNFSEGNRTIFFFLQYSSLSSSLLIIVLPFFNGYQILGKCILSSMRPCDESPHNLTGKTTTIMMLWYTCCDTSCDTSNNIKQHFKHSTLISFKLFSQAMKYCQFWIEI